MEIKELFLKNPEYMLVFADEQEAFKQAKQELDNKIFDGLKEKFKVHKYNFGHVEKDGGRSYWWKWLRCHICNISRNTFIDLVIEINSDDLLWFGIILFDNKEYIFQDHERCSKIFNKLRENCSNILEQLNFDNASWLFHKNIHEKVKFTYNLDSSLDNFIREILSDIQKLKGSEDFKDYKWLV